MLKRLILLVIMSTFVLNAQMTKREIISSIKGGVDSTRRMLNSVPIDYMNSEDDTLLHYAVRFRKRKVVEFLVRQKILISRKGGPFYGTALQESIHYGHLGIATYLIQMGSDLNTKNRFGNTALHIATKNGYLDIVKLLLGHGASKKIYNDDGKAPVDLIPNLSWDSSKEFRNLLEIKKRKRLTPKEKLKAQAKSLRLYMKSDNRKVISDRDENRNKRKLFIGKRVKVDNKSHIGMSIDTE
jgi:hypothetical protein